MGKLFIKISILLLIYLLIFYPLHGLFDRHYQGDYDLCEKQEWVLSLRNRSFEDGFIGSSRAFNMLDMDILSDSLGRKCLNLATSGSNFSENLLLLHLFCENGNSLDRLFVQVDVYGLDSKNSYSYPFHDYIYLPYMRDSLVDNIYQRELPAYKFLIWKYIPFVKYMEFNDRYSLYKFLRGGYNCTESEFDQSLGSEIHDDGGFDENENARKEFGIAENDLKSLKDLLSYCKKKGIEVVFYQAPEWDFYVETHKNREEVMENYKVLVEKDGLDFLTFEKDTSITRNRRFFKDYTHLNKSGVEEFSLHLARRIREMEK